MSCWNAINRLCAPLPRTQKSTRTGQPSIRRLALITVPAWTRKPLRQKGTGPIQSELERISRLNNPEEILDEVARLHERQVFVFFTFYAQPDPKMPPWTLPTSTRGDSDCRTRITIRKRDDRSKQIRQKYVAYAAKIFELIGVPQADAQKKADTVLRLETELAKGLVDSRSAARSATPGPRV